MTKFEFFNKLNYDIDYYYEVEGGCPVKIYISKKLYLLLAIQSSFDGCFKGYIPKDLKYHNIPVEIDYNKEEYYYCLVTNEFGTNEIW